MNKCEECANKNTIYCEICKNNDLFMNADEKKTNDIMCKFMCGNDYKS